MIVKEIVVGLGHQKSLWDVAQQADEQVRVAHGTPLRVVARAHDIEVEAARPRFDAGLESVRLRFRPCPEPLRPKLRELAARPELGCRVTEQDGALEVACPAPTADAPGRAHEVCDLASAGLKVPEVWRVEGLDYRVDPVSSETLFRNMIRFKASDVHLYPGSPPVFRVDNVLRRTQGDEPLSSEQIEALIRDLAPARDWKEFQDHLQCSFIFHQVGLGYGRVSAFVKAGVPHATMRFLPERIPSFEDLALPRDTLEKLAKLHFGMILVAGMTGSGKSTTVASLVDWINEHRSVHTLCIEEPVEYVHANKRSVVSQRDVGVDVRTFQEAVRGALRHDPDVIVIGEMRDPDTIRSAINAAATGHLVISTLHSGTAYEVVNRIVSFFDPVERDLVRLQLRDALRCVICQRLVSKVGGGRLPALEVLFNDTKHIADSILTGNSIGIKVGMQQDASSSFIFEKYLYDLLKREVITVDTARDFASERSILEQMRLGTYVIPSLESMLHHDH